MTVKNLFQSKPISINVIMEDTGETISFVVFMRPLKVKDIEGLNHITHLQEINPADEQAAMMLVNIMTSTLSMPNDELPIGATDRLITHFIEYNFPKDPDEKKTPDPKKDINDSLVNCFDFLISTGHKYNEIMEYPIPLFNSFVDVAAERLGLKKQTIDPAAAFRKLGLPIKSRADHKK
jgi:hypothetical protein